MTRRNKILLGLGIVVVLLVAARLALPYVVKDYANRKLAARPVGIEETVRFFIPDMLAHAMPGAKIVSANPVVRGCRMIKTPAELALMQLATDVTIAAYRWTNKRVEKGMTGRDIGAISRASRRG